MVKRFPNEWTTLDVSSLCLSCSFVRLVIRPSHQLTNDQFSLTDLFCIANLSTQTWSFVHRTNCLETRISLTDLFYITNLSLVLALQTSALLVRLVIRPSHQLFRDHILLTHFETTLSLTDLFYITNLAWGSFGIRSRCTAGIEIPGYASPFDFWSFRMQVSIQTFAWIGCHWKCRRRCRQICNCHDALFSSLDEQHEL